MAPLPSSLCPIITIEVGQRKRRRTEVVFLHNLIGAVVSVGIGEMLRHHVAKFLNQSEHLDEIAGDATAVGHTLDLLHILGVSSSLRMETNQGKIPDFQRSCRRSPFLRWCCRRGWGSLWSQDWGDSSNCASSPWFENQASNCSESVKRARIQSSQPRSGCRPWRWPQWGYLYSQ